MITLVEFDVAQPPKTGRRIAINPMLITYVEPSYGKAGDTETAIGVGDRLVTVVGKYEAVLAHLQAVLAKVDLQAKGVV